MKDLWTKGFIVTSLISLIASDHANTTDCHRQRLGGGTGCTSLPIEEPTSPNCMRAKQLLNVAL
jgi:hypothetical protein